MTFNFTHSFVLDNFEGPLELLLCLVQKEEVDVCAITLQDLTQQLFSHLEAIDVGSEILHLTATLLLIKSQKLLPKGTASGEEIEEENPRLELIQQLLDYCRFKEVAKVLTQREEVQQSFFPRASSSFRKELGSGLEEVGLDTLKALLQEVLDKSISKPQGLISQEVWLVSDKIEWFRHLFQTRQTLSFYEVFSPDKERAELIVFFLALLELMKSQELQVFTQNSEIQLIKI